MAVKYGDMSKKCFVWPNVSAVGEEEMKMTLSNVQMARTLIGIT